MGNPRQSGASLTPQRARKSFHWRTSPLGGKRKSARDRIAPVRTFYGGVLVGQNYTVELELRAGQFYKQGAVEKLKTKAPTLTYPDEVSFLRKWESRYVNGLPDDRFHGHDEFDLPRVC